MIDLSFLTEEERETILAVLKRDTELKKAEEQRVQKLHKNVSDKSQLRYLTGEWFYETKQLRHQDRIHGSDIIRASMRHTHKPLTILELSQILPEKSSFVSSENKEVFVPPVLCGLLQEPHMELSSEVYPNQNLYEPLKDTLKADLQSSTKRKNPFNSELVFEEKEGQLLDGAMTQTQTTVEVYKMLDSFKSRIATSEAYKLYNTTVQYYSTVSKSPALKIKDETLPSPLSTSFQEGLVDLDGSVGRQTNSAALLGILKQLPASSSTVSLASRLDPQSPVSLSSPTDTWIDRKQVRFSSVGRNDAETQNGKELGEHSLLDINPTAPCEAENASDLENSGSNTTGTHRPLIKQSPVNSQEIQLLSCKNEAEVQEQEAGQHQVSGDISEKYHLELLSPAMSSFVSDEESGKFVHLETEPEEDHHSQAKAADWPARHSSHSVEAISEAKPTLLGIFRREKEKSPHVKSPQEEELYISKRETPGIALNHTKGAADSTVEKHAGVKQEAKIPTRTEIGTLQLIALQNALFNETLTSVKVDPEQEETEGTFTLSPQRLSNLRASLEREKSGPKKILPRADVRLEGITKRGIEAPHGPQSNSDVKSKQNNPLLEMEMTEQDTAVGSKEKPFPHQTDCSLLADFSKDKEDGTYRANPVLIYEEMENPSTGSVTEVQISEPQEDVSLIPSSVALNAEEQERDIPVLPRQSDSNLQDDRPPETTEHKHFSENKSTASKVIGVKEALSSSVLSKKAVSAQSDLITSSDNKEKSKGEAQTFPCKTTLDLLKPLKVTDKGFISDSSDRPQLRSSGSTADTQSSCHQFQVNADTKYQERPLSPNKSQPSRSKESEEVRRSPTKTLHPKVLPRESSSTKGPGLEGSPLKTFLIDINPQTKVSEKQQAKPTPVPRQKKSPSLATKQILLMDSNPSANSTSPPLPLHPENRGSNLNHVDTLQRSSNSTQPKKDSEEKFGTFTPLARSVIPQDHQHYLGPQEKAHVPVFHQSKASAAESDDGYRSQSVHGDFLGNQSDSPTEGSPSRVHSWIVQIKDGNSSQDSTNRAWSLSRTSSGSYGKSSSPIMAALKRLSSRSMSSSKSLENLTSQTRAERTPNTSREQMDLSVDDVFSFPPTASTFSESKLMKTSVSVPALQHDETDSDSPSEAILRCERNTSSSMSNLSLSSGMASMSSVSGSISSIYPADFGDIEVQGSIQFAVNYVQKLGEFHIFVVDCRNLAVADAKRHRSDPYVKCYLLPEKTNLGKRKTTVKKKTLNPTYNEILRFKVMMEVLKTQNLNISVWHNDTFGRNSFLGEVDLNLSEWDFSNTQINEYTLKARVSAQASGPSPSYLMDSRGQMRVALRFLQQTSHSNRSSRMKSGEVQIWVKDCKNLPPVRGVIIDPFVKCTVLPDTSQKSRQKTRVVKRTANPMFNHTMVYDGFRPEDLREACVEITVWDHDRLSNHYIGGLRLGLGTGKSYGAEVAWMDSTADEVKLWQRMLQSDGEWVEDVLPLRMLVMAKGISK